MAKSLGKLFPNPLMVWIFILSKTALSNHVLPGLPYRQDDPRWAKDVMWSREKVIEVDVKFNNQSKSKSETLLRKFEDGSNIGNEGCLLTTLAMVLRLLDSKREWTPRTLNKIAQDNYFYTPSGLSMTTLYADLVSEASNGEVQLLAKEDYLTGVPGWPKKFPHTSSLIRAYRSLKPKVRDGMVVMIKTGTYDDTVASHYLLLHPGKFETPDSRDPEVLDPAQPLGVSGPWYLSNSSKRILEDLEIKKEWVKSGVDLTQVAGAWIFSKKKGAKIQRSESEFFRAWGTELNNP